MTQTKMSLYAIGLLSIGIGVFIIQLLPSLYMYSILLIGIGVAVIIIAVIEGINKNKFDELWHNLNLSKGTSYPVLIDSKYENEHGKYKFSVPSGLGKDDFIKNKSAIEQILGCGVEIYREGKDIIIEEK
ncbi:MAG: hypothetical protein PHE51_08305 [Eubacteriales bacterium]|nr:hypothetical protein [Eubacteriales bacterium]